MSRAPPLTARPHARASCSDEFQESLRQMRALEAERTGGGAKRARGKALKEVRGAEERERERERKCAAGATCCSVA